MLWFSSVADPDPGLGAFLTPGSGIRDGRKSASGSGILDEQPGSYFLVLRNHLFAFLGLKCLNSLRIRDPGWRQFGSGMGKSRIRDKHPGSATLWFYFKLHGLKFLESSLLIRLMFYERRFLSSSYKVKLSLFLLFFKRLSHHFICYVTWVSWWWNRRSWRSAISYYFFTFLIFRWKLSSLESRTDRSSGMSR